MKITTHCLERSSDEQVSGFLVGSMKPAFIEVTNAFPLPDNPSGNIVYSISCLLRSY